MNNIPAKFNGIVLLPKKSITDLRMLLFEFPRKGEKIEKVVPFRTLQIKLEYNNKKALRPLKIEYKQQGIQYLPQKEFIKFLRLAKNVYIVADKNDTLKDFCEMLKDFQINYTTVEVCRLCLLDSKITFLEQDRYYRDEEIMCFQCAMKEFYDESEFRGFKPNKQFSDRIEDLLKKRFHNISKVLKIFEPGFDASKNSEFTYYDTIEAQPNATQEYPISEFSFPQEFLNALEKDHITKLHPIQQLAIEKGLSEGANLLIVAPTGTGKTLIGELGSIPKLFRKEEERGKILYLGNLVALVNQKYETFKKRYGRFFRVAIRVGMSKLDVKNEDLVIVDEDIQNANIITASYEAFDFLLRKGPEEFAKIGKISTIIIDEIQVLDDEDRGAILAGLIARVQVLYPKAQIIGLSATIGNSKEIGKLLHLKPIVFNQRAVPLERHLVLTKSEHEKFFNLVQLVKKEAKVMSKYGFKGSTIVFTNARWRTEALANLLQKERINAMAYHAGLTYNDRKFIETAFEQGLLQAVCTTYALGAGFDSPCSTVILESMAMGNDILTPNMYLNMIGRAGRFQRHELGKAIHLVEIGKSYPGTDKTEDQIALDLLESSTQSLMLEYDPDLISTQVLAAIAAGIGTQIEEFYNYLISAKEDLSHILKKLRAQGLITLEENNIHITPLGHAIALSFFTIEEGLLVIQQLHQEDDPLNIAIQLEFFENIYIPEKLKKIFQDEFKINLPNKFLNTQIIDITTSLGRFKSRLRKYEGVSNSIALWQSAFFTCNCGNAPYCDCSLIATNRKLIDLRMEGRTPKRVSHYMERNFNLKVYSGDLLRFFDNLIHRLQGIKRIAQVIGKPEIEENLSSLIQKIEKSG